MDNKSNIDYKIEPITNEIREKVNKILIDEWEETNIIIRGKVVDGTKLDGFVATKEKEIIGLITLLISHNECEICSLNSFMENKGIGTALINKAIEYARKNNCNKLRLITTNDNIRAIYFYQKRGFKFSNIYINSMENSRKLKPEIPLVADNGIPIRDELEFEYMLS